MSGVAPVVENNTNRYIIIAVVLIIVVALVIWGLWYLMRPTTPPAAAPPTGVAGVETALKDQIPTKATLTPVSGETTGQTVERTFDDDFAAEAVVPVKATVPAAAVVPSVPVNGASLDEILAKSEDGSVIPSPPKQNTSKKIKLPVKVK